jgi:AcrR family transcriptional regulator
VSRPARAASTLTDDAIAKAALAILNQEGQAALSFRRIADALNASHMAVHRHCSNLAGLLDICAEHLANQLPDIDPDLAWEVSTELRFTSLYDLMSAHWALVALQRGRPWLGPTMMQRFAEPAVAASLAAGFAPEHISTAHRELFSFTVGCALTRTTFADGAASAARSGIDTRHSPTLASHLDELRSDRSDKEIFQHGVRAIIASWQPDQREAR